MTQSLYNTYQKAPTRRYRRVSDADVAAVREGLELGWTHMQIQEATDVGASSISRIRRGIGMYARYGPSMRSRRSGLISQDILAAVKQGVEKGMSYADLRSQFGVSAGTVAEVKRSMGLLGPVKTALPQEAIEEPQEAGSTSPIPETGTGETPSGSYLELVKQLEKRWAADRLREAGSTYTPQQYFEAISEGIEEYHRHLAVLESRIEELTLQNKDLHSALIQARAAMSGWSRPGPIPTRNMSTGG
jgi:uncharacterized protein YerC